MSAETAARLIPPLSEPVDLLLDDIAIRVQLSRTNYNLAVSRYQAINDWLERDGSLLRGRVRLLYPQGSMAIGATIAARLTTDYFDIDLIAQLDLPAAIAPQLALDLLYWSIRGERGSRYYDMTDRCTRCVKVRYADGMELDVTPAVLLFGRDPRTSHIFHHKPDDPTEAERTIVANPWGFAEWFKANTPLDHDFVVLFEKRASEVEGMTVLAKADAEPVPDQEPPYRRSKAVIVLQLLKRWRNVRYDRRDRRRPPSIMIAKLVADAANHTDTLAEELLLQVRHMLGVFERSQAMGQCVRIENPTCRDDVLTDRWPGSLLEQAIFIADLRDVVAQAERLVAGCDLAEMRAIMSDLFGEAPTGEVFKSFNERVVGAPIRAGRSFHQTGQGRYSVAAAGLARPAIAPATVRPTRPHTFFGADRDR
jgi:hypothetical protein